MPLAHARYDLVLQHGDGYSANRINAVVDMLEMRDTGPDGSPGRLRSAQLECYEAPRGFAITYERLAIAGRAKHYLVLNGWPQKHFSRDRRWLRWVEDPVE